MRWTIGEMKCCSQHPEVDKTRGRKSETPGIMQRAGEVETSGSRWETVDLGEVVDSGLRAKEAEERK